MQLIKTGNGNAEILFTKDEFGVVRGCLGEPLGGFSADIPKLTGRSRESAVNLRDIVREHYKGISENKVVVSFSVEDIRLIIDMIKITLHELEIEFQTRVGRDIKEALAVRDELQVIADSFSRA